MGSTTLLLRLLDYLRVGNQTLLQKELREISLLSVTPQTNKQNSFSSYGTLIHGQGSLLPLKAELNIAPSTSDGSFEKKDDVLDAVRKLLRAFPEMAHVPRVKDWVLPLHLAALIGDTHLGSIILSVFPGAAEHRNVKGKTPLHFAAREGHLEMVILLLQINPSVSSIVTDKLKLPLHFAASEGHVDICQYLLAVYPDGASIKSDKGKLPLHLASRFGNIETVSLLSAIYPKGLYLLDWESSPPLHIALREGQEDVATCLIRQCPEALRLKNISGELPLDIALRTSPTHIVYEIIRAWPEGGREVLENVGENENVDEWEWSKIELCLRGAAGLFGRIQCHRYKHLNRTGGAPSFEDSTSLIRQPAEELSISDEKCSDCQHSELLPVVCIENDSFPLNCSPDVTSCKRQKNEYLPLHTILEISSCSSLIKRILEACPDQLKKEDQFKRLPLHLAATHCVEATLGIAESVLRSYPEAVSHRDVFGRLPLHVALCNKAELPLVLILIKENPAFTVEICMTKDKKFSSAFPLFMATEYDCNIDVIFTMLSRDPSVMDSLMQWQT